MLDELLSRFYVHDRLALAAAADIGLRGEQLDVIRAATCPKRATRWWSPSPAMPAWARARWWASLAELLRAEGKTVAVLACDPQSPLTGGALLGDRVRMPSRPDDPGLFIRSVAAASGHQAVAEHLDLMIRLLAEFGFDVVLLETVGAGQGDTAVRELADVVVLLVQPETGDELQWEKAGLLEVADVVVVHKADLAGAERMEAQVRELLSLPGCRDVPVLRVSSAKREGLDNLWCSRGCVSATRPDAGERCPHAAAACPAGVGRAVRVERRTRRAGDRPLAPPRSRRPRGGQRTFAVIGALKRGSQRAQSPGSDSLLCFRAQSMHHDV